MKRVGKFICLGFLFTFSILLVFQIYHVSASVCGNGYCELGENMTSCPQDCRCDLPVDIVLTLDVSGSMDQSCTHPYCKIDSLKTAANKFVDLLNNTKQTVGLVSFKTTSTVQSRLTFDYALIHSKINALIASTGTNVGSGISKSITELTSTADGRIGRAGVKKVIVLLSDGMPTVNSGGATCVNDPTYANSCTNYALTQANAAKAKGIIMYTIGFGTTMNDFQKGLLTSIASSPDKFYYYEQTGEAGLTEVFNKIADNLCTMYKRCSSDDQIIMRLSQETNAITEDINSNTFSWEICYEDVFNKTYTGPNPREILGTTSDPNNLLFWLHGGVNSSVSSVKEVNSLLNANGEYIFNAQTNEDPIVILYYSSEADTIFWNAVSFPINSPINVSTINSACGGQVRSVLIYNASSPSNYSSVNQVEAGKGYFIAMGHNNSGFCTFDVGNYASLVDSISISLKDGWNLISAIKGDLNQILLGSGPIWNPQNSTNIEVTSVNGNEALWLYINFSSNWTFNSPFVYGNLSCGVKATCNADEEIVASLNNEINARISAGDDPSFLYKLCCKDLTPAPPAPECTIEPPRSCSTGLLGICSPGTQTCSAGFWGTCIQNEQPVNESCNSLDDDCNGQRDDGNVCRTPDTFWKNSTDTLVNGSTQQIIPGTTQLELWVTGSSLISEEINFTIFNVSNNQIIKVLNATVMANGAANVNWTIELAEVLSIGLGNWIRFNVSDSAINISEDIKLNVETTRTGTCGDYQNATECNAFTRTIARASISPCDSVIINDFCTTNYQCSCAWNAEAGTCGGRSVSQDVCVSGENFIFNGSCEIRDSAGDNCDDGFLDSSLTADWTWGNDVSKNLTNPNRQDFIFDNLTGYYYYDPNADSLDCLEKAGENTIPCPGQIRLPFFGFYQLLISLLGIGLIYLIFNRRKFYK